MSAEKIRAGLVTRFTDAWAAVAPTGLPLARVEMPNQKSDRTSQQPWARLTVAMGGRNNAAIGGTRLRQEGILYLQVFLPEDSGTKTATDAYDALASIFDNATVPFTDATGFIHCRAATATGVGTRPGYEQFNYGVPFYSDDDR